MKAIDLLKYLDKADPKYVEEASDFNLLLYRKRRKRTRVALAACLALVVLAGVFLTGPALTAWETRNTVTSWPTAVIRLPGTHNSGESSPLYVSAEMPAQKRFSVKAPFTLSVGLGQASDYEYATLSVEAYGFEITDKEGNTVTDRYVRTLSDFDSDDYGMLYRGNKNNGRVTGCSYLEDFTFRFLGTEKATGWGVIQFKLTGRDQSGTAGDSVAVYYILQNGVLKLTDKNPVRDGSQNGNLGAVLEETETAPNQAKTVELSHEGYNMTVSVTDPFLVRGEAWQEKIDIRGLPLLSDFMVALYPKDTAEGRSIRLMLPSTFSSVHDFTVPADALLGSYDLVVTWYGNYAGSEEARPEWIFEDFVTVTEPGTVTLSKEDISVRVEMPSGALTPGQFLGDRFQITAFHIPTQKDYPTDQFTAELIYAESLRQEDFSFVIKKPVELDVNGGFVLALSSRVPHDAPIGSYDLRIADGETGFVWTFENLALVLPADIPAYEDFVFEPDPAAEPLIRGANLPGGWDPFFLTLDGEDMTYQCRAVLEYRAEQGGDRYSIILMESMLSSYLPPDFVSVDAPVGMYDLVVTHGLYGYTWRAENFIEILENPEAERFGLYHDMGKKLTVSRSSGETYIFIAKLENRGDPFTVTADDDPFMPEAMLTMSGFSGAVPLIPLQHDLIYQVDDTWTVQTGYIMSLPYTILVAPDTPLGLYDLILSYGDCVVIFEDVVEVVP
ncbi:MAG: hypothetical protein J6K29_00215 [Clostridia bacterium]|nr:hypothetical protein [Clostridia bacterium]